VNDKKFTTYDRDKESGLDYAMNRMYASMAGRFPSVDEGEFMLEIPSTLNRYIYAVNDPINFVDSQGTEIEVPPLSTVNYRTCMSDVLDYFTIQPPIPMSGKGLLGFQQGALEDFLNSD
jgi:RHS repeat-associated protein